MMDASVSDRAACGEAELVAHLRAGDAAAYATLMRRNNQRIYRLARGVLGDDAEAEEAVQEGYIRAFTHLDGFKGEASLATWLARIVLNEALGRLRRRRPTVDIDALADAPAAMFALGPSGAPEPTPEQAIARRELSRAIESAVDALPAGFRSVFVLRAIEQMDVAETADALGIPEQTVKTRLHRANKLLRNALAARFGTLLDGAFPFLGRRCERLAERVLSRLNLPAVPRADWTAPPALPP